MSDLVIYRDAATGLDYAGDIGETTPVSWQPRHDLTFNEWMAVGNTLAQISASVNWWVGDWLNYGEKRYGETYAQGMNLTGWAYERLANVKSITKQVKSSLRNELLTWTHHVAVASLEPEEQAAWLNRAAVESMSTRELQEAIRGPQIPPPALSLAEPEEAPFNHQPRWSVPVEERTAVDEYEQQERFYPLAAANHAVSADPDYDGDEWYTPAAFVEAARTVMGGIDFDPASCDAANEVVRATRYLTKGDDALRPELLWQGRVWMNPPYSTPLIKQFVDRIIAEYETGSVTQAVVLVNNCTETGWFHALLSRYPVCFTRGRVQFWRPDATVFGARQGQALFYLGDNFADFQFVFGELGQVMVTA